MLRRPSTRSSRSEAQADFWNPTGPEDPIFFDPDADEPRPIEPDTAAGEVTEELRQAGTEAGIDPALIEA
jgi:hypothetical protein